LIVHLLRTYLLGNEQIIWLLVNFAFIPARYTGEVQQFMSDPAALWSPVTYSFLHGDWTHIIVNTIWLLAFGAVVARRLGNFRFILFCIASSLFGALAHYVAHSGSLVPMIGASAVVSGCMGAAVRFAFPDTGSFSPQVHELPAKGLFEAFQNRQVVIFTAVWFAINFLFGISGGGIAGEGQSIAWEAHIGGFLCGLLFFRVFDRNTGA
ncbi:MAG: rhomboid family intramembrane serine protease, partial [Pseudomonadota bacterium]